MKRIVSVFLVVLLLLTAAPLAGFVGIEIAPKAKAYSIGDTIQFGNYPQTQVDETPELQAAAKAATWKSYGYFTGTGSWNDGLMTPSDYMRFADFFYGRIKYRAVTFSQYRPYCNGTQSDASHTYQDDNGYTPNNVYYFKYEPLTWSVLDPSTGYIMCENIIDSQAYQNKIYKNGSEYYQAIGSSVYATDYATSSIRTWLNSDFYETAFTDGQKEIIKTTTLNNDAFSRSYSKYNSASTNDKVFLLSWADVLNTSYGFSSSNSAYDTSRLAKGTDYAKCQGLQVSTSTDCSYNSPYRLRSPGESSCYACDVNPHGYAYHISAVYFTSIGIRPVCKLVDLASDITQYNPYNLRDETYGFPNYNDDDSYGHCFGMAVTSSGYYTGALSMYDIGGNESSTLYSLPDSLTVRAPICHYMKIQGPGAEHQSIVAGGSRDLYDTTNTRSDWTACVNYVKGHQYDNKGSLTVGMWFFNGGGHAVNFLYYKKVNGQQRIYVYDNNHPDFECYYYMGDDGYIYESPEDDHGAIDGINLMDIYSYFTLAPQFDRSRYVYAEKDKISIEGAKVFDMKTDFRKGIYVMFEIPKGQTQIIITPKVDNAVFTYMDQDYQFETVDDYTYGVLTLADIETDPAFAMGLFEVFSAPVETHTHEYTFTITTEPTCTETGLMNYTCACGDTYSKPIPATGIHVDEDNDGYCDTCGDKMTGGDHCIYCGKIHDGFFGWLVRFFHKIFALFKR